MREYVNEIKNIIDEGTTFLVSSHVYPDGDALGSELALALALKGMGKKPAIINADRASEKYGYLPGFEEIRVFPEGADARFDGAFVLDAGVPARLRKVAGILDGGMPVVNIDHHVSNSRFGTVNVIDPDASSTSEMLYRLFGYMGVELTKEMAINLFAGVATDTGRFSFDNTRAETLEIAADLVRNGADPSVMFNELYRRKSLGEARLLERALSSLRFGENGRFAWIELTARDFEDTGTEPLDTQEFAEIPRSIVGAEVGLFFREEGPENFKGSLRSNSAFNASAFASNFGGGGHPQAAGFTLWENIAEARERVLKELETNFENYMEA